MARVFQVARTRQVRMPERAYENDPGLDLFIPDQFDYQYVVDFKELNRLDETWIEGEHPAKLTVEPRGQIRIPMGIHMQIPEGYAGYVTDRASAILNTRLQVGAQMIGCDYRGEIKVHLINPTEEPVVLQPGTKIVQMVIVPVSTMEPREKDPDEFMTNISHQTLRGAAGWGSTGHGPVAKEETDHV